ncbi:MAG: hypothetical protein IJ206_12125 [Oscillospiraceae bacterium]|nr:hypothetical protein [Oscillospiraceae bacterium]
MNRIQNLTIRFNLNKSEDRAAWERLRNMDRKQYKSYSKAVITAVNDHFDRQERHAPFFGSAEQDDRFFQRVREAVNAGVSDSSAGGVLTLSRLLQSLSPPASGAPAPIESDAVNDSLEEAMAFIDSL